jgi:phosphonate transport system substrate-binding protein
MEPLARTVSSWLQHRLGRPVEFVDMPDWRDRETAFDSGQVDLLWICGLPYVRKADSAESHVRLAAAPVMADRRYGGRPVYFSDVVVQAQSMVGSFPELEGKRWSINEPGSHSGYNVVRDFLGRQGLDWSFFAEVVESGSHERSLAMIRAGEIDASAIDSTVLETAIAAEPRIAKEIKVLTTLGPSPIPPWIVREEMDAVAAAAITLELVGMHETTSGRNILARWGVERFAQVTDKDYDPIREMDERARQVGAPPGMHGLPPTHPS